MIKKMIAILMIVIFLGSMLPRELLAATRTVKVTLPSFQVSLNEIQVDNVYRQYPLIVYKDITYFPMTYSDCRFLGIETTWSSDKGLAIDTTGISGIYSDYKGDSKNNKTFTATIPTFNIQVNGKVIDPDQEEYPFLNFRDVTYFPLTWKFAVDELGWEYQFDSKQGLVIQSPNPQLEKVILSEYTGGDVITNGGNYYYGGAEGAILQAAIGQNNQVNKVYQLPKWSYGDGTTYAIPRLSKKDGEAWLTYHQGGAIMGSDYYVKLKPDGTYEEMASGYLNFNTWGNMTLKVGHGVPPGPNNLFMKKEGQEYQSSGDPAFLYGWNWEKSETSAGGAASNDLYFIHNYIYLMAFHMEKDMDVSRIHKVDIQTNETNRVSDLKTKSFVIEGDFMYFVSEGKLYRLSLNGGKEELLTTAGTVSSDFGIQVLNGRVYYVSSSDHELYVTENGESLNHGGKLTGLHIEGKYLIGTFAKESSHPYGLMVFNKDGKVVFKSADGDATHISIDNDLLTYVESSRNDVYTTGSLLQGD